LKSPGLRRRRPAPASLAGVSAILVCIAAILVWAFAASGCASALREPRPIADLAGEARQNAGGAGPGSGAPAAAPADVPAILGRAEALYAERGPGERGLDSVRMAAREFLRAAAADGARIDGLVGAARARVWLADHEAAPAARQASAGSAVEAAQWCGRIAPLDRECDYWLGAALGVQARERSSTALDALPKIEAAFKRAADALPALDEAGPDRALALLYLRAPGWPAGPGDSDLGLRHARAAVALRPGYPPNQLALAEALAATGGAGAAGAARRLALELARKLASAGDPDAPEWIAEAEKDLDRAGPE